MNTVTEILIHLDKSLDEAQRQALNARLLEHPGVEPPRIASRKPHLIFLTYDTQRISPHEVVGFVNEAGFQAQLVDI